MARTPSELEPSDIAFLRERHLGTLTTLRPDGTPHVVAIAFVHDRGTVTVLARDGGQKVVNVEAGSRAVVCQVDGRRWLSLEGTARVSRERVEIDQAVARYQERFRPVSENPERVIIVISVDRVLGHG